VPIEVHFPTVLPPFLQWVLQVASSAPQSGQEPAHKAAAVCSDPAQCRKQQIAAALRKYKAAAERTAEQPRNEAVGQGGQSSSIKGLQHTTSGSKAGDMLRYKSKTPQSHEVKTLASTINYALSAL